MELVKQNEKIAGLLRESLAKGFPVRLKVISNSMSPLLQTGDWINVETAAADQLACGEIIVVQCENDLLTHRVIAVHKNRIITKGDNTNYADPLYSINALLGRVTSRVRNGQILWFNEISRQNQLIGIISLIEIKIIKIHRIFRLPFQAIIHIIANSVK